MLESWGFAAPVLAGKEGAALAMADHLRANKSEWDQSHDRAAITLERTYLMRTPMGTFFVEYGETKTSFGESLGAMLTSTIDLDRWIFKAFQDVTGIDFTQPPPGPPPELVLSYYQPKPERGRGLAFAAPPLAPGKADEYLSFCREATERMSEFSQARQSYGITVDRSYLNRTPMGDILVVYLEGEDPVAGNAAFAASRIPFDVWFRERVTSILGIDFTQPLPPIEPLWEWRESRAAATAP
jgi:hypothetical protein